MPWQRRREVKQSLEESKAATQKAGRKLEETKERRARERQEVIYPLRRARRDMLEADHVTEEIVKIIRGNG